MNDLEYVSEIFHATLYADDTTLCSTLNSFGQLDNLSVNERNDKINCELNKIHDWLAVNKLSLNVGKTKFMVFHTPQKNITNLIPKLKINDHKIDQVSSFNFGTR